MAEHQAFRALHLYSELLRVVIPRSRGGVPQRPRLPERLHDDVGLPRREMRRNWQDYC